MDQETEKQLIIDLDEALRAADLATSGGDSPDRGFDTELSAAELARIHNDPNLLALSKGRT